MGHYDSCRDETWSVKGTKCSGKLLLKENKWKHKFVNEFKGEHKWVESGYGIQKCEYCGHTIFYT
jgi:DNA-directed RNA polymerase subunit RPC12/RpoP